jgi:hypothetical protein
VDLVFRTGGSSRTCCALPLSDFFTAPAWTLPNSLACFQKKLNQLFEFKGVSLRFQKLAQLLLLLTAESGMQLRVWGEDWRLLFTVRQKVII